MKKLQLLVILVFAISYSSCKSIINRKNTVTQQLNNLKSGVLFVRLPTNEGKIKKLKEIGKADKAKKEAAFSKQFQKAIFMAFEAEYDFSKIYFYYSPASKAIKNGEWEGNLYDAKENLVSGISFEKENIFYGEFGQVHQEELTVEREGKVTKVAGVGGTKAFVIRNENDLQPERPFPYSVSYDGIFNSNLNLSIRRLNNQLKRAHLKMQVRYQKRKAKGKRV